MAEQVGKPTLSVTPVCPNSLSIDCLELIAHHTSFRDRCAMTLVNRHWCSTLRSSSMLWAEIELDLDAYAEKSMAGILQFVAGRSIVDLDVSFSSFDIWPSLSFMLGCVKGSLVRCCLTGSDSDCELPSGSGGCLYALRGLTSLNLDNCITSLSSSVSQLASLSELIIARDYGPSAEFEVPAAISRLTRLTCLELLRCTTALPNELTALVKLRRLVLQGNELCSIQLDSILKSITLLMHLDLSECSLQDMPAAISGLRHLSCLRLNNAFSQAFGTASYDAKLACLSSLRLIELDISENEMTVVPRPVACLDSVQTLKMGLNPLEDVADGPYLSSLLHLDLRGSVITSLPQYLTKAQRLHVLDLSCCHDLVLDSTLAEDVIGRLKGLSTLVLCGQQMNTVDSAKCLLQLGKMLPDLQVSSHGETDDDEDEEEEEDTDEDYTDEGESEYETDFTSDEDEHAY